MAKISSYYDLDPQISYKNILTRCADETKKNNMYLTTEGVREVVEANKERVKIINTGVKAFARFDQHTSPNTSIFDYLRCENKGATCDFRLAQEGVLSTVPFIGASRLFNAYILVHFETAFFMFLILAEGSTPP